MSQPPYSFPSLRRWFVFVKNFGQYESFLAAIPANRVFATPNGSAGNANYRQLVSNDIPYLLVLCRLPLEIMSYSKPISGHVLMV